MRGVHSAVDDTQDSDYVRHDGITDFILEQARQIDFKITKEDIYNVCVRTRNIRFGLPKRLPCRHKKPAAINDKDGYSTDIPVF